MTAQIFNTTLTNCLCGSVTGIWNSTPRNAQVIQVTGSRSRKPVSANYCLHGQILETVTCAKYLGYDISSDLSWRSHIDRITGNFVRRNIKTKHPGVREMAYNTLVRPQLEYAAAVWDPHTKDKSYQVEKVQRRAARWVSCNFVRLASVFGHD